MPFGIQHTILYPQDKKHNYSFPSADGMLASETFVAEEIDRTLTKAKIEDLLEYNTRFVQLPALFRSTDSTLKDVTNFNFAVTNGKKYEIMLIAAYQSNLTTVPVATIKPPCSQIVAKFVSPTTNVFAVIALFSTMIMLSTYIPPCVVNGGTI